MIDVTYKEAVLKINVLKFSLINFDDSLEY